MGSNNSAKETVLLVGATGYTGSTIAKTLTEAGIWNVRAVVRPSSLSKPEAKVLETLGVQITPGDLSDTPEQLDALLQGVDILISTTLAFLDHKPVFLAAKRAGVKRVVPSDFGPHIPRGVMVMQDLKLANRDFLIEHGIPYTFIQVGWWANFLFPTPHGVKGTPTPESGKQFVGTGDVKVAWIAYENVSEFVRRIIADPRTLNATVQAYDGETTLTESWALGTKISGEDFSDYPRLSAEEVEAKIPLSLVNGAIYGYAKALYIRGDNTVEKAVEAGALDGRKLYPDYVSPSLEQIGQEYYKNPPSFTYEL